MLSDFKPSEISILVEKGLPQVDGRYQRQVSLGPYTWFRTGGAAEVLFKPANMKDLASFLKQKSSDTPCMVLGMGSNLLVRDGGVSGVVIRLGSGFREMTIQQGGEVYVGAGALGRTLAQFCAAEGWSNLEFLCGIPGTVGGALRMNAGAYGTEIKDHLIVAQVLDPGGNLHLLTGDDLGYGYRTCSLSPGWIFVGARFQLSPSTQEKCMCVVEEMLQHRSQTQPVRTRTGGSTFKNPHGQYAWKLIDQAGFRGRRNGGAQVSSKHCNFLINTENATSKDLEALGEMIRKGVYQQSSVQLTWEIERVGLPSDEALSP